VTAGPSGSAVGVFGVTVGGVVDVGGVVGLTTASGEEAWGEWPVMAKAPPPTAATRATASAAVAIR
jgi:hypothetical protein